MRRFARTAHGEVPHRNDGQTELHRWPSANIVEVVSEPSHQIIQNGERVEQYENAIIGVNNRNLRTFDINLNNSIDLKSINIQLP